MNYKDYELKQACFIVANNGTCPALYLSKNIINHIEFCKRIEFCKKECILKDKGCLPDNINGGTTAQIEDIRVRRIIWAKEKLKDFLEEGDDLK